MKLSEVLNPDNKFFVYEGNDLKAAQPTFNGAMRYFKEGRIMYNGTPTKHNVNVTKIAIKIKNWNNGEI